MSARHDSHPKIGRLTAMENIAMNPFLECLFDNMKDAVAEKDRIWSRGRKFKIVVGV